MKAVLSLAFLAFAQAAFIEVPELRYASPEPFILPESPISPIHVRSMIYKYGLEKPVFDEDFMTFSKSLGLLDPRYAEKLRSIYDEPALAFFMDPMGEVISYYADSGIQFSALSPEIRSVFNNLLSSSDSFAIAYEPEHVLESPEYKMLSGRFFQPIKDVSLSRFIPWRVEPEHFESERSIIFKRPEISSMFPHLRYFPARFDFDELPYSYKTPVSLKYDYPVVYKSDSYKPHYFTKWQSPLTKYSYPWTKSPYSLVEKYPMPYAPSYYKALPYSPLYNRFELPWAKYELPYARYELPYAKYELPYAKYELPYAKYELPYAKYELPYAKYELPYAKYELPYAKYELPYAKYELPYAKYELPYAKYELPYQMYEVPYTVVPEEYLRAPYIKPIAFEDIRHSKPIFEKSPVKYVKPEVPVVEKEVVVEAVKPVPRAQIGLRSLVAPASRLEPTFPALEELSAAVPRAQIGLRSIAYPATHLEPTIPALEEPVLPENYAEIAGSRAQVGLRNLIAPIPVESAVRPIWYA